MDRETSLLAHGSPEPPADTRLLRAGPLTAVLDGPDLRYIRLGDQEILRRVYVGVRDRDWGTLPPQVERLQVDEGRDGFAVTCTVRHTRGGIDFRWQGEIRGLASGVISYRVEGHALTTFQKNRVGLCVLHPASLAGQECTVRHPNGRSEHGTFPGAVSPHQPFLDIATITHPLAPGLWAQVELAGDWFEMEDQRNWSDASFKTYCTPLSLPIPAEMRAGTRIHQSLRLSLHGLAPAEVAAPPAPPRVQVQVQEHAVAPVPRLGLCHRGGAPAGPQAERLRALRLHHLRADIAVASPDARERLRAAAAAARAVGARLLLALRLPAEGAAEALEALGPLGPEETAELCACLVLHPREKVASATWIGRVRALLPEGLPLGGGTDHYFTELNRNRPDPQSADFFHFSLNPQVHAWDDTSLVETLAVQGELVRNAREFCGGRPVAVGPVTLRPRANPNATAPDEPAPARELPADVDLRQLSLLGAGWTVGSLAALGAAGPEMLTYGETTGWRGVLEHAEGPERPDLFPSAPGICFPVYHVLADVGECAGGELLACASADPLRVVALACRAGASLRLLLANLTADEQAVAVTGLPAGPWHVRLLDTSTFSAAAHEPETFRADAGRPLSPAPEGLALALPPYAVARLDRDSLRVRM